MNFQVTILKVLVSYPDGFASLTDLKRDIAILTTSGKEWSERTKRLAARAPNLAIFSQGLVERLERGWRITEQGRSVLEMMEAPVISDQSAAVLKPTVSPNLSSQCCRPSWPSGSSQSVVGDAV
jgi:hypothetical protein